MSFAEKALRKRWKQPFENLCFADWFKFFVQ